MKPLLFLSIVLSAITFNAYATDDKCNLDVVQLFDFTEIKNKDCRAISQAVKEATIIATTMLGYSDATAKENKLRSFEKCQVMKKQGETLTSLHQSYNLFYYENLRNIDCTDELEKLNLSRKKLSSIVN